jgi:formylglycine-generating enzyme required for sulfatase activity
MPRASLMVGLIAALLLAQDTKYPPQGQQFPGPLSKADTAEWLREMRRYRDERRVRAGLGGALYERPELAWAQSSFIQPQAMIEDRYLYDPATRRYTVDRYLDDVERRYGGIDSILLWPVYPNIGVDNRNQFDLLRDLPGGLAGVRQMVADFHRRGVRVLFPTMPWDTGTRREPRGMPETIAALLKEVGADGINGDTFGGLPHTYRDASDAAGHPLVLEPEGYPDSDEMLDWDSMSWGYWKYPFVPMVSRGKWLEPRHMVNVCDRWAKDKTDDLQAAFFNGVGFETWENVWGIWNGLTERDAEAIRRVAKIERRFAPLLVSRDWEPHTPTVAYGVFASRFPGEGGTLWTLVNRTAYDIDGPQLAASAGMRYFELWHGVELRPQDGVLSFAIEAHGFGAILAQAAPADAALSRFLAEMRALNARPLASFSKEWHFLPQRIVPIERTEPADSAPDGMVKIPAAADFRFEVHGVEIEGGDDVGVDVQYPGEDSPRRHHIQKVSIAAFYIDRIPVTDRQFGQFVKAVHYRPADDHNFLKDWSDDDRPVTWVSIEDARAYAKWAGKRLPHEWEWQYAAPAGDIWEWTDEFQDDHTRAAILRGGGRFRPEGSRWYFPPARRPDEHGKYLLMAPSKDRSAMIGFRCVRDLR